MFYDNFIDEKNEKSRLCGYLFFAVDFLILKIVVKILKNYLLFLLFFWKNKKKFKSKKIKKFNNSL